MKKLITIIVIIAISFSACEKEEQVPECELNETGEIQIHNFRDYTYGVYLDTTYYGQLSPNEIKLITAHIGFYTMKFTTDEGYYYYKTIRVRQCKTDEYNFEYF